MNRTRVINSTKNSTPIITNYLKDYESELEVTEYEKELEIDDIGEESGYEDSFIHYRLSYDSQGQIRTKYVGPERNLEPKDMLRGSSLRYEEFENNEEGEEEEIDIRDVLDGLHEELGDSDNEEVDVIFRPYAAKEENSERDTIKSKEENDIIPLTQDLNDTNSNQDYEQKQSSHENPYDQTNNENTSTIVDKQTNNTTSLALESDLIIEEEDTTIFSKAGNGLEDINSDISSESSFSSITKEELYKATKEKSKQDTEHEEAENDVKEKLKEEVEEKEEAKENLNEGLKEIEEQEEPEILSFIDTFRVQRSELKDADVSLTTDELILVDETTDAMSAQNQEEPVSYTSNGPLSLETDAVLGRDGAEGLIDENAEGVWIGKEESGETVIQLEEVERDENEANEVQEQSSDEHQEQVVITSRTDDTIILTPTLPQPQSDSHCKSTPLTLSKQTITEDHDTQDTYSIHILSRPSSPLEADNEKGKYKRLSGLSYVGDFGDVVERAPVKPHTGETENGSDSYVSFEELVEDKESISPSPSVTALADKQLHLFTPIKPSLSSVSQDHGLQEPEKEIITPIKEDYNLMNIPYNVKLRKTPTSNKDKKSDRTPTYNPMAKRVVSQIIQSIESTPVSSPLSSPSSVSSNTVPSRDFTSPSPVTATIKSKTTQFKTTSIQNITTPLPSIQLKQTQQRSHSSSKSHSTTPILKVVEPKLILNHITPIKTTQRLSKVSINTQTNTTKPSGTFGGENEAGPTGASAMNKNRVNIKEICQMFENQLNSSPLKTKSTPKLENDGNNKDENSSTVARRKLLKSNVIENHIIYESLT